jgi:hypothetical protein
MKIPIRMIGIATTFLWIFLIAFAASAFYSMKDLQFEFGDPQMSVTSENKLLFSMPITVTNVGYYNVGDFNVTTEIIDEAGFTVVRGSTFVPVIKKGDRVITAHNMTVDIDDLLQNNENCLFEDMEMRINEMVSMKLAEMIPVQASTNFSVPWGAPLYNFTLGEIAYSAYNLTHLRAVVPVSFENHAFFDLTGNIQMRMYNSTDALLGEGQTAIEVAQNSPYDGYVDVYVSTVGITSDGRFEVYFTTPFFNAGPLVIPYG